MRDDAQGSLSSIVVPEAGVGAAGAGGRGAGSAVFVCVSRGHVRGRGPPSVQSCLAASGQILPAEG